MELGLQLKTKPIDYLQNSMTHTNDSYRSPPNSGFSCRNTQFNMFHSYKRVILIKTGILDEGLSQLTSNLISISRKILILDNLFVFCVQGDHTGVKMRGDMFSHGSKRYRVVIGGLRWPKL